MKHTLLYSLFFLLSSICWGQSDSLSLLKEKADSAYADTRYAEALRLYTQLADKGNSVEVAYNLGNTYYRLEDLPHAILWYERALLLSPGDSDIRFNLQLSRSKTADKIIPEDDFFLIRWYYTLLNVMRIEAWIGVGIACFVLTLLGLSLYLFSQSLRWRKMGFYGFLALFVLTVLCNVMAWRQHVRLTNRDRAVVMSSSVTVKSSPADSGKDLFVLHEGTVVRILDDGLSGWMQVRLPDGKEGWMPQSAAEVI